MEPYELDTNALDTPEVPLPDITCHYGSCTEPGPLMVRLPDEEKYTFWCAEHVPPSPIRLPEGHSER